MAEKLVDFTWRYDQQMAYGVMNIKAPRRSRRTILRFVGPTRPEQLLRRGVAPSGSL